MTRYAVQVSVDGQGEQSSVVEAETGLEAEHIVIDHPAEHIHGYQDQEFIVTAVEEIWEGDD